MFFKLKKKDNLLLELKNKTNENLKLKKENERLIKIINDQHAELTAKTNQIEYLAKEIENKDNQLNPIRS